MNIQSGNLASTVPFDTKKLDELMEAAGIDVLIATSKHNAGYLLGGYRFFFFETMDAIGINRYLPVFIYAKGQPDRSIYLGNRLEVFEKQLNLFWTPVSETSTMSSVDAIQKAAAHIKKMGVAAEALASRCRSCRSMPPKRCVRPLPAANWSMRRCRWSGCARPQNTPGTPAAQGILRARGGFDAGDGCGVPARHDQARRGGTAAPGGNQPRAQFRILPDDGRHQPQPRAVGSGAGHGRHHVDRLRRQLSRLYRRSLPDGHHRRARRRTEGFAWLHRDRAAGGAQAGPGRRRGRR